jgi:hypothetical protein
MWIDTFSGLQTLRSTLFLPVRNSSFIATLSK